MIGSPRPAPTPKPAESDAALMATLAQGNLAALGVLYDRYHEAVQQFLHRAVRHADAEDLTHETFLTLSRVASSYDGRPSARAFIVGIAAQLARRRRRTFSRWSDLLSAFGQTVADAARRTPEDEASDAERLRRFERALALLSDEKRLVFLMIERECLSGEEVAQALEIPIGTVWTRLHHARSALRRAIAGGERR